MSLTQEELELYKICWLPYGVADKWLLRLIAEEVYHGEYSLKEGEYFSIEQKCSLGGDTDELFIYRHTDGEYYLVQCLLKKGEA